jgi:transcriptional regulator with XRE-family HTH domain
MAKLNVALKVALIATGKKQKQIAKRVKISEPRLSTIVRGHDDPTEAERARLSEFLGKPISELFPEALAS